MSNVIEFPNPDEIKVRTIPYRVDRESIFRRILDDYSRGDLSAEDMWKHVLKLCAAELEEENAGS